MTYSQSIVSVNWEIKIPFLSDAILNQISAQLEDVPGIIGAYGFTKVWDPNHSYLACELSGEESGTFLRGRVEQAIEAATKHGSA